MCAINTHMAKLSSVPVLNALSLRESIFDVASGPGAPRPVGYCFPAVSPRSFIGYFLNVARCRLDSSTPGSNAKS